MPDHLKSAPNTKEFHDYLQNFLKKKEKQHRRKVVQELASTALLMIAG